MSSLSMNDVLPALRRGVECSEAPRGLGEEVLRVSNLCNGQETCLRGFEYSLARMLDGRRKAGEVLEAAAKLGLPVSLEALDAFLKKLAGRNLLSALPESTGVPPLEPRECWKLSTRKLFRLALRKGREGHLDLAVEALDALLSEAPSTVEAHNLRHSLKTQLRSSEIRLPFSAVFAQAEREWLRDAADARVQRVVRASPRAAPRTWLGAGAASLAVGLLALGGNTLSGRVATTLVPSGSLRIFAPARGGTEELIDLRAAQARLVAARRRVESVPAKSPSVEELKAFVQAEADVGWAEGDFQRTRVR